MKQFYLLIIFLTFSTLLTAQNLVGNPGFETFTSLPNAYGQYARASGWTNCGGSGTADYYHTSGTTPTGFGPMSPHTGGGQMGFLTRHSTASVAMEYVCRTLNSAMLVGQTYEVSFFLTRGTGAGLYPSSTGNIGAYFSIGLPVQPGTAIIPVTPQVEQVAIVNVTNTWQQVSLTFTPTAAFNSISIGNFRTFASTPFINGDGRAYYYIDDIVVRPIILLDLGQLTFNAKKLDEDKSLLLWHFERPSELLSIDIQRSANGVEFDNIASGKAPELETWTDETPFSGANYYRLRMLAVDGTISYSDIKVLNFESSSELLIVKIFPNPFRDWLVIDFQNTGAAAQSTTIEIHDMLGRMVHQEKQELAQGHSKIELSLAGENLAQGSYILSLISENGVKKQFKVIKQ